MYRVDASKVTMQYRCDNLVGARLGVVNLRHTYKSLKSAKYAEKRIAEAICGVRPFAWHVSLIHMGIVNPQEGDDYARSN